MRLQSATMREESMSLDGRMRTKRSKPRQEARRPSMRIPAPACRSATNSFPLKLRRTRLRRAKPRRSACARSGAPSTPTAQRANRRLACAPASSRRCRSPASRSFNSATARSTRGRRRRSRRPSRKTGTWPFRTTRAISKRTGSPRGNMLSLIEKRRALHLKGSVMQDSIDSTAQDVPPASPPAQAPADGTPTGEQSQGDGGEHGTPQDTDTTEQKAAEAPAHPPSPAPATQTSQQDRYDYDRTSIILVAHFRPVSQDGQPRQVWLSAQNGVGNEQDFPL